MVLESIELIRMSISSLSSVSISARPRVSQFIVRFIMNVPSENYDVCGGGLALILQSPSGVLFNGKENERKYRTSGKKKKNKRLAPALRPTSCHY